MLPIFLSALSLAANPPQDSALVDSRQTFEQTVAGITAPDNVIRTLSSITPWTAVAPRTDRRPPGTRRRRPAGIPGDQNPEISVQSVIPVKFRQARDPLNNTYGFHCRPKATFRTLQFSAHSCDRATDNQSISKSGHPAQRKNPAGGHYDPQAPGTLPPCFLPNPAVPATGLEVVRGMGLLERLYVFQKTVKSLPLPRIFPKKASCETWRS